MTLRSARGSTPVTRGQGAQRGGSSVRQDLDVGEAMLPKQETLCVSTSDATLLLLIHSSICSMALIRVLDSPVVLLIHL